MIMLLIGILVPLGSGVFLLENSEAQLSIPQGEAGFLWDVSNIGNTNEFSASYKLIDGNGVIIISGVFDVTSLFGSATGGSGGYQNIVLANSVGPYTMVLTPMDSQNIWTVIGGYCQFEFLQQIDGRLSISNLNVVSQSRNFCTWVLDNDGIPPIDDTIQNNLDEIVSELEGKDQQIQTLLDKQAGHDDAISQLENFKVTIDGDKIKFKELELTVDQMIASLELILQELLLL